MMGRSNHGKMGPLESINFEENGDFGYFGFAKF